MQVCVRVLTPLHVWSGQVLDGRNELVRVPGGYGVVDGRKLRVLLGRDLPEDRPLWMLVREASADPRAALKYLLADRTKGSSPPAEVRPVVKDAFHRPYLPGSTLRGLLRTAAILQALADDTSLRAKAERVALDEPDRFTDWLLDMTKHVARTRLSDSTAFSLGPALYFAGVYRLGQGRPSPMFAGTQQAGRVVEAVPPGARARLVLDGKEPDRALRLLSLLGEWQAGVLEKCGLEAPRVGPPGRWGLVAAVAAGGGGGLRLKPAVYFLGDKAAAAVISRSPFGHVVHAKCGGIAAFARTGWYCRLCGARNLSLGREVFWGKTATLVGDPPVVPGWVLLEPVMGA